MRVGVGHRGAAVRANGAALHQVPLAPGAVRADAGDRRPPQRRTENAVQGGLALQQLWLFWLAPLVGGAVGGWLYRQVGADSFPKPNIEGE